MTRLDSLRKRIEEIEKELEALKGFRLTPNLKKFQRALFGEQSFVKSKLEKLSQTAESKIKIAFEKNSLANKNRSSKMKRTWRYLKAIQQNYFPKLTLSELRTALRKHRQGLETDVPDVAWRNPSP
ncbi:MAG: uncharacterized protein HW410_1515 [Nitrosarchaeum sp.]|nr:uncharacterized protein [Nitrosarchaeum sp.]